MDGKGQAIDNVMIERLWRSYKYEYLYLNSPENGQKLKKGTKIRTNFYNKDRFHQTLDEKITDKVYQEISANKASKSRFIFHKIIGLKDGKTVDSF